MTPRQELLAGIREIRKRGWYQGSGNYEHGGTVCIMTAGRYNSVAYKALLNVIGDGITVMRFNDRHCKTVDDAIAAMEIAADLAS